MCSSVLLPRGKGCAFVHMGQIQGETVPVNQSYCSCTLTLSCPRSAEAAVTALQNRPILTEEPTFSPYLLGGHTEEQVVFLGGSPLLYMSLSLH
ncbi:hypothetical protein XELAEV_18040914mg [Xenopus laevis]|uniref:Uncharacterized protein n=1 Tax=Xenopus laevis TaxID=8355 RepID=A0A974H994_XENLA|nr:hypothetical protein XELAEV_18040914mg [Xenopus laevis]